MAQKITTPAVAYLTAASKEYYNRPNNVEVIGFELNLTWDEKTLTFPEADGLSVVYERLSVPGEVQRFLNGSLSFYKLERKTVPGPQGKAVRRVAVLGLTKRGAFGFLRTVDYLSDNNNNAVARGSSGIDFQIFASNGGNYRHESVIEAGSVTSLA